MNKKKKKSIIIGVIIILLIMLPFIYYIIKDEVIKSLIMGILSSIIASTIFYLLTVFLSSDRDEEFLEYLKDEKNGIVNIRGRDEFDDTYWLEFLKVSNDIFISAGRTMNRWLDHKSKKIFIENLKRLIKNGSEVILIIYKNLDGETENKEKEDLKVILEEEIFPICLQKKKGRLEIRKNFKILEVEALPYLYNRNDYTTIVGPYFQNVDNDRNIMFVLENNSKFEVAYKKDFDSIIKNASINLWLQEFLAKKRATK